VGVNIEIQKEICNYIYKDKTHKIFVDFFLKLNDKFIIIEYNGEQHYNKVNGWGNCDSKFDQQCYRDSYLIDYCNSNKIKLIIIDGRIWKNIHNPRYKNKQLKLKNLLCEELY
jgi:very-short-patch-repair endonuclease